MLILLVIGLVGIGAAAVALWPTFGLRSTADTAATRTKATVVRTAQCGGANARDTVEVTINGQRRQLPLNGCGQARDTVLDVVVSSDDNGQVTVQPAQAAQVGSNRDGRLAAVLLALSALAGALYAYLLGGGYPPVWSRSVRTVREPG